MPVPPFPTHPPAPLTNHEFASLVQGPLGSLRPGRHALSADTLHFPCSEGVGNITLGSELGQAGENRRLSCDWTRSVVLADVIGERPETGHQTLVLLAPANESAWLGATRPA